MKKIAFLFPGQGSQAVGMGQDMYQEHDIVRELFDMAEEISSIHVSKLCFKGPIEELTQTVNLQPAITAVNLACLALMEKAGVQPAASAGHSLGEYSALRAAGVVSNADTFRLVCKRGELMDREANRNQGAMHAIVGLSMDAVQRLVEQVQSEGVVSVANHNTETQIVITGAPGPVQKVSSLAAAQGAKSIALKVSGAWHSSLIKGAEPEFKDFLDSIEFRKPHIRVIHNVTADSLEDPNGIKSLMVRQLCSPVRWYDSMKKLMEQGIEIFVEAGPGKVLTGLLKKILPKEYPAMIYNVSDLKSIDKCLKDIL